MNKLKQILEKALKSESAFCDSESGELNYTKVKDSADKIDKKLISLLADNKDLKNKFFIKIKDVYVFNIQDFKFFLDESKVDNSYTQYANKIGLADNSGLLENRSEVVLDFPFKDCVLEGGQSTEEGTDTYFEYSEKTGKYEEKNGKRNEVFFNQVLAHDEIDRLFDRKALVNWKRFTKDSKKDGEAVKEIKRDKTGLIQENLIIKGNNLLALHSLKSEFAGKIKLIYIDPPYNTENGTFKYNDTFNHSTWLTFMKNRLEVAKDLLSDDGSIYVNIDYNEAHYLKILMDEVFGRTNFQREIIWRIGWLSGYKTVAKNYIRNHDTILYYTRNKDNFVFNKVYNTIKDYAERFNNENRKEILDRLKTLGINKKDSETFIEYISQVGLPEKYPLEDTWNSSIYDKLNSIAVVSFSGEKVSKMLDVDEIKGQKSEKLLKRIIEVSTNEGDFVLDYHLGTGTTGAVAHKMNRRYIGVEQLDYIENTAVARLCEVIKGEKAGISKEINWQGGGDFIYCELAKWNEKAKEEIQNAKDLSALVKLFDVLYEKYFLNYNVKIKDFKDKIIKEENFKKLTLAQQKKMFLTMLDLNQMYVQESEMADKKYGIGSEDQKLTKAFYSKK
ncbi:MAG TPA: site-specific DNA-methyltransferase [Candidatus Magasanikbacteria bacterium]|nr:site-specific DNA-methyltransferase [Candidatus Magasanikbacteria bacterium]